MGSTTANSDSSSQEDYTTELVENPLLFKELCWPDIQFYDDQVEIIQSVNDNIETVVPAGNMLGKDFVSAFIALWFFCSRSPARVVTSSVDHSQLKGVLWGEIRRFIDSSRIPLGVQVNDLMLRQQRVDGTLHPLSEMIGRVAQKGEGLLGRHVAKGRGGEPRTLAIIDEASGFDDIHYESMTTWAHRILIIGNPYPCENFFKKHTQAGNLLDPTRAESFFRKVIQIPANRSPNVRLALEEIAAGKEPSHREIVPGCMSYREYEYRKATWDPHRISVGLLAEFYEGAEVKLYPADVLSRCVDAVVGVSEKARKAVRRAMGVDTAEGGDSTVWTVVDEYGLIDQISMKTPDTSVIPGRTLALMRDYRIDAQDVLFDTGGGGKEHVDFLRSKGYSVRGIAFGAPPTSVEALDKKGTTLEEKRENYEDRAVYKNRRAEMYGETALVLKGGHSSGVGAEGFHIPRECEDLLQQLKPLPKLYDGEGKMYLPPKNKPTPKFTGLTISGMLGRSPDEADSFVLAVFGLIQGAEQVMLGPTF